MAKTKSQPIQNAGEIIERFGGIRPMAAKIDTPVTTVQGWKKRDVIPATRREQILTAAQDNNIDISDISGSSTTTQPLPKPSKAKKTAVKSKSVSKKSPSKSDNPPSSSEAKEADTVTSSSIPKVSSQASSEKTSKPVSSNESVNKTTHDEIMDKIEEKNRKAVISSVWITVALVLIGLALALFILWPLLKKESQELNPNVVQKIEQLETKVEGVEERTSFIGKIIPENLQEKIDGLQEQAADIQQTVSGLANQAGDISRDVFAADAGPLSNRLEALEEQVAILSDSQNFNTLISRVQELEDSFSGQEQLKNSVAQLQSLVTGQTQSNIDNNLANVQNQNQGPLGETLQGVSGNDLKAAAMLLAFSKFRDSLNREESFEDDLVLLQRLAGKDNQELQSALTRLAPKAETGVLTPQGLSEELRSVTGDIVFSSLKGEDVSIKEKAVARLNNVFQVEKEGEPVLGTETQITVARAQKLLDEGNVEGALKELQNLDGEAELTATDFIKEAQSTLMAQQVQEMISNSILSKVTNIDLQQLKNKSLLENYDVNTIKRSLEKTLPAISGGKQGVRDDASGLTILPNTQTFKGFSGGQNSNNQ